MVAKKKDTSNKKVKKTKYENVSSEIQNEENGISTENENVTSNEEQEEITKEEVKPNVKKRGNLFQSMKNIIWF